MHKVYVWIGGDWRYYDEFVYSGDAMLEAFKLLKDGKSIMILERYAELTFNRR